MKNIQRSRNLVLGHQQPLFLMVNKITIGHNESVVKWSIMNATRWIRVGGSWLLLFKLNKEHMGSFDWTLEIIFGFLIDSQMKWVELQDKELQVALICRICSQLGYNGHIRLCFLNVFMALWHGFIHWPAAVVLAQSLLFV